MLSVPRARPRPVQLPPPSSDSDVGTDYETWLDSRRERITENFSDEELFTMPIPTHITSTPSNHVPFLTRVLFKE